jgi:transcriptional repressor NrdR
VLCPVCRSASTKVLDSRDGRDGGSVRRRRSCNACGHRFTTHERIEETLPFVVKRDGSKQAFDRGKLLRGLQLACRKRPVLREQLDAVVQQVEQWSSTRGDRELHAAEIGERVMHHLYELDEVAYVRFVSVYRSFESVAEFSDLLREMEKAQRVDPEGQRTLFPTLGALYPAPPGSVRRAPDHPLHAADEPEPFAAERFAPPEPVHDDRGHDDDDG